MIFELSEQLEPIGRLDIVESMQQQVANYYQRFGSSGKATDLRRKAVFLSKNGNRLYSQGDLKGAEAEYRMSHEIFVGLSKRDPSNSSWQRDLSISYNEVGDILQSQGDLKGAEAEYRKSHETSVGLSKRDPSNSGWQQDVVISLCKLANIYKNLSPDTLPLQKKYLEKALKLLKSLNKQGRLPKGRLPWIGTIEQELAAINKTK